MEKKYYKHKLENLLVVSKIVTIHYFEFDKDYQSHTESHDFWELVYAERGDIITVSGEREITIKEGEVFFHKPGVSHSHRADGKRAPSVFIISFECKNEAMRYFEEKHMPLEKSLVGFVFSIIEESKRTFDLPYFDPSLKKMRLNESPALGGQQMIKNYLELLLISLMRAESEKENSTAVFLVREQYYELISDMVIDYLKKHVCDAVTVDDVCTELHYNRSYIYRQFKKTTGMSIMACFMKLKISKAKELLRESKKSIAEISYTLSFDNPNYFSKAFKRSVGYTPSTYRKIKSEKKA